MPPRSRQTYGLGPLLRIWINTILRAPSQPTPPRPRPVPRANHQRTPRKKNLRPRHLKQLSAPVNGSLPLRLGGRKKTTADKSSKTNKVKKAPPQPAESIQLSRVRPIRKKTIIETGIIRAEQHAIWVRSSAITVRNWAIMQTSALNFQKTNLGLDNLFVDSWG